MIAMSRALAAACLLFSAVAQAASFDCGRASHPLEKAVCADGGLSRLDDELAAAWRSTQAACADPTQFRLHAQQDWMADVRREAAYYNADKTLSRAEVDKAYAGRIREEYHARIAALGRQAEDCRWRSAASPHAMAPVPASPLDCSRPADVVETAICKHEEIRKPAQQLHAAFAAAMTACADPQVLWRHPLAALLDEAKRTARANEERRGVGSTPEDVELGDIHRRLRDADRPWNELKEFCRRVPLAERRPAVRVTKASEQLVFTLQRLGYIPGEEAVHFAVQDAKSRRTLAEFDLPSVVLTMEGGALLVNSARLYDDQGTINAGDFNFDGQDDFAVQIGNEGAYGGPNYAVFLRTPDGFVHNPRMSDLTREGLGFFGFDAASKTLSTFSKSGCCDHWGITYEVVDNQPVPVRKTRDVLGEDGMGRIEDSIYTGGRWKKVKVRKYRPPEYCEESLKAAGESVLEGHRAKNYISAPLCALLPGAARVGVWFSLMPTLKPGQAQWGGGSLQGDWGIYMAVAHAGSDGLLGAYANPAQFTNTYASSEDSALDTRTFARVGPDPVWALMQGLRGEIAGRDGEPRPRHDRFNLFRWDARAQRIDNILANLVMRAAIGNMVTLRKLTPLATRHNGLADLEVEEARFARPAEPGPMPPADAQKQRWVLQFDGVRYPLPPALTRVP
ncbi:MAG TPA: hypothetical protein VF816_02515 [Rhodocyclaceae bacterium]